MAVPDHLLAVIDEQLEIVLSLDIPEINEAAQKIAYYTAMLDAAIDDPMDDPEEQAELVQYLKDNLKELTETYQSLVNDNM